ncbi:histidine phosphatase family protein [Pseudomonas purpurea]|uniref:lipopolysaccharide core heptose(II)-phosphate phosphatase PmrG n=1 Tax=Pseudomonas purpurea TaxID=3136737 RepID=UPI003267DE93
MANAVLPGVSPSNGKTRRLKKILLGSVAVLIAALVTGFAVWPRSPLNLGESDHLLSAGVYQHWKAGDLIVLVRHAERCDRSSNPCLGPADGITRHGNEVATQLGKAFQTIGMENADVVSSPTTRTQQTSTAMFAHAGSAQDWAAKCDKTLGDAALKHKARQRNLVLITHSGCISDVESALGFEHAQFSEYTSSLFVTVGNDGQLKILGLLNAEDWPQALKKTLN